ncbi:MULTISPECIES: ROK family transcriptional regulator [unclassified Streptomyces]|uniref:ROK family transcriptional regulator n=1 Tax=unclassified Streptomyces TaxID=2593676 RepID=UPI0033FBD476
MSDGRRQRYDRATEVQSLIDEMKASEDISDGLFSSLGMMVTDASLAGDEEALEAAHEGLRRQYGHQRQLRDGHGESSAELRGRLLGLIDVTYWALRRLPSALQLSLDPAGHAARFLVEVARQPGQSNAQLAARLGVDITEVSRIGRKLVDADVAWKRRQWRQNSWDITPRGLQYLEETGLDPRESSHEPRTRSQSADFDYFVGIKVRPGRVSGVVTDAMGTAIARAQRGLKPVWNAEEAVTALAEFVRGLLAEAPAAQAPAAAGRVGLGVEIGGHVDAARGRVVYAPNYAAGAGWAGFSLAEPLRRATGLPTVLENDANALVQLEETYAGPAAGRTEAAVILDQGVGAGLMLDGRIHHGATGSAGEIGHVVVQSDGPLCSCGNSGCLESVAGTDAIANDIRGSTERAAEDLDAALALLSNAACRKYVENVLGRTGAALGIGLSALINLANPDRIVLYGPARLVSDGEFDSARLFMAAVRRTVRQQAFSTAADAVILTAKPYDDGVGALAAAAVARQCLSRHGG